MLDNAQKPKITFYDDEKPQKPKITFYNDESPKPKITFYDDEKPQQDNKGAFIQTLSDIAHGVDRGYMKYGAGINKGLAKVSGALGFDGAKEFFDENYWRNQHLINEDNKEIKNRLVGSVSEALGDPLTLMPLGIIGKSKGFANTAKSVGVGGAIAGTSGLVRDYGDESINKEELKRNLAINTLLGGGTNALFASKLVGQGANKIANKVRDLRGKERVAYNNLIARPVYKSGELYRANKPNLNNPNFIFKEDVPSERKIMQEFTPDEWVNKTAKVEAEKWIANLTALAKKHPKMFKDEKDIFKFIKEVKDNPTHFLKNNNDYSALLAKALDDKKAGNIAVTYKDGKIIHANKTKIKDLKRLERKSLELIKKENKMKGTPFLTTRSNKNNLFMSNIDSTMAGAPAPATHPLMKGRGGDLSLLESKSHRAIDNSIPNNARNVNNKTLPPFLTELLGKNLRYNATNGVAGGVLGASQDDENRLRGALLGAVGGIATGQALPRIRNVVKQGKLSALKDDIGANKKVADFIQEGANNKEWKNIADSGGYINKAKNLFNRNFTDTLGGDYHKIRDDFLMKQNQIRDELTTLQKSLENLSEQDREIAHKYLVGELDSTTKIAPELQARLDNVKKAIDDNQKRLVEQGIISQETVDDMGADWLHRMYEKKPNALSGGNSSNITEGIYQRGKSEMVSKAKLNKMIDSGAINLDDLEKPLNKGGIRLRELENGQWEIRTDYTPAEREAMGEIMDASKTIPASLMHQSKLIMQGEFIEAITKLNPSGTTLFKPLKDVDALKQINPNNYQSILKSEGFSKLPNDNKFGKLKGQWVRTDIHNDLISQMDSFRRDWGNTAKALSDGMLQMNKLMKKSKTVYNPISHVNNTLSNVFFLNMLDVNPTRVISGLKDWAGIVKNAKRYEALRIKGFEGKLNPNDLKEYKEYLKLKEQFREYDEARKIGLFGKSMLNDVEAGTDAITLGGRIKKDGKIHKIDDFVSGLYQGEDNMMRYIAYKDYMKKGYSPQEAKKIINSMLPDYTKPLPKGIRVIRDSAISPFISWTYYVMPKLAQLSATPAGYSKMLMIFGGLGALGMEFNPFEKGKLPIRSYGAYIENPLGDKSKDVKTQLKVDRWVPQLQLIRPREFMSELLLSTPYYQAFTDVKRLADKKPAHNVFFDTPATYKNKKTIDKAMDLTKHYGQTWTPMPQVAWNFMDTVRALTQEKNRRATNQVFVPRSDAQSILKLLGLNVRNYSQRGLKAENRKNMQKERETKR